MAAVLGRVDRDQPRPPDPPGDPLGGARDEPVVRVDEVEARGPRELVAELAHVGVHRRPPSARTLSMSFGNGGSRTPVHDDAVALLAGRQLAAAAGQHVHFDPVAPRGARRACGRGAPSPPSMIGGYSQVISRTRMYRVQTLPGRGCAVRELGREPDLSGRCVRAPPARDEPSSSASVARLAEPAALAAQHVAPAPRRCRPARRGRVVTGGDDHEDLFAAHERDALVAGVQRPGTSPANASGWRIPELQQSDRQPQLGCVAGRALIRRAAVPASPDSSPSRRGADCRDRPARGKGSSSPW